MASSSCGVAREKGLFGSRFDNWTDTLCLFPENGTTFEYFLHVTFLWVLMMAVKRPNPSLSLTVPVSFLCRLDGNVRGMSFKDGRLMWVGKFREGRPVGNCWSAVQGDSWLYGTLDRSGH